MGLGERDLIEVLDYAKNLDSFANVISSFTESSERKFLEIGSRLNDYLHTSEALTNQSKNITTFISNDTLQKGIYDLNWLLNEFNSSLSASLKEIQNDKTELTTIQPHIQNIINTLDGFSKIVKQLRMLGIATKIESARLGTEDQGFNALAENVDKLSNQISDKVINIANRSNILFTEINKTIQLLGKLEKEQGLESESILKNIRNAVTTFENKHIERIRISESIGASSQEIRKSIHDIVTSIQFHDITRQQLEHIKHALDEVSMQLKQSLSETETDLLSEFGSAFDVCQLQSFQLRSSLEEFISAVNQIILDLNSVNEGITRISISVNELLARPEEKKKCCLSVVVDEIVEIKKGFERNKEIGTQLAQSINSVVSVVDDLSKYILEIEDVGSEIEIIALNARVKAARTGSNGSALGVLSERIQKLSIDAKDQTVTTSKILSIVSNSSFDLRTNVENRSYSEKNESITDGILKISSLVESMIEKEESAATQIERLQNQVQSFKNGIELMIDNVDVHDDAKNVLSPIIFGLEDILTNLSKHNIVSNKNTNTAKLLGKYTMKSERLNHQGFATGRKEKEVSLSSPTDTASDLGDNVELF